jgi:hypothetical protein
MDFVFKGERLVRRSGDVRSASFRARKSVGFFPRRRYATPVSSMKATLHGFFLRRARVLLFPDLRQLDGIGEGAQFRFSCAAPRRH